MQDARPLMDLTIFAQRVQSVARQCPSGRFGANKVFIAHVWRALSGELGMDLTTFKRLLTAANNQRLIRLSRADLVAAMDPQDVAEPETHYLHAQFHFIRI